MQEYRTVREAFLRACEDLVRDHPRIAAGSVIRCMAREVERARRADISRAEQIRVAEARARAALVRRTEAVGSDVAAGFNLAATAS